jgi:phosphoribosylformylglycinamidine synthase subunit PurS
VRGSGEVVGFTTVARVVVDVMPKPEILDPQGQAVTGALARIGIAGVADVRQGKHFELEVDDAVDDETLHRIAGQLLANPVIEDWTVTRG